MRMLSQKDEQDDVDVTWEDQQRINTFSKLNTRHRLIEEKLEVLKQEKEALDDLTQELELTDEDEVVLYKVGESFFHIKQAEAMKRLEKDQGHIDKQVSDLSEQAGDCDKQMKELKVTLYARFGSAINLDE